MSSGLQRYHHSGQSHFSHLQLLSSPAAFPVCCPLIDYEAGIQRFLELGLVDEIRLTIAPVLLGDGLRLFGGSLMEERWDLKNVVAYKNGFVELSYSASTA
jgi:hypothetical protein